MTWLHQQLSQAAVKVKTCMSITSYKKNAFFFINFELIPPLDKMVAISQTTFSNSFLLIIFFCIWIWISLKFVPKCPIENKSALVQIMTWHRTGDKPLSEPMLTWSTDAYMRRSVEISLLIVAQWRHMATKIWVNIGSVAWWYQAINWTNIGSSSVRSSDIQLRRDNSATNH